METFFYYTGKMKEIQTKKGPDAIFRRKATVALIVDVDSGAWARGVAICSDRDNFCKKKGRAIALSRARAALEKQKSFASTKMRESIYLESQLPAMIDNKSTFKTIPSNYEVGLIKQAMAMAENSNQTAKAA